MRAASLAMLLLALCSAGAARSQDAVRLVEDIERRLEGQFIFTTPGDGAYAIYQRVENRRGLTEGNDVICLAPQCYVQVAEASEADLRRAGDGNLESVRRRFRSARDAYTALQRAPAGEVPGAAQAWRDAGQALGACLRDGRAC